MRSDAGCITELKKGKLYRIRVSAGYNPETGKRVQASRTVRGTKGDAKRELARMLVQYANGGSRGPITLGDFYELFYLPDCRARLRPSTVDGYAKDYDVLLSKPLGSVQLDRLTPATIDVLLSSLPDGRRRKAYSMLRQILNKAVRWDMLESNPLNRVEPPKPSSYEPCVLDAEQAKAYIAHFKGSSVEPAVLIAIGAGLRRSEIVALDWSDVHDGKVDVTKGITRTSAGPHQDEPKSRFGIRSVHIPSSIYIRLEELRGEGPLMLSDSGGRISPDGISKRYAHRLGTLPDGLPRIPFKNLRHTSLTLALEGGADILAVSRRGGHSGPAITSRYYLRPHENVDKSAAEGLDSLL